MPRKPTYEELEKRIRVLEQAQSQHRETEERLLESETRYRNLFEESPISLWDEDFSEVNRYIGALRESGVTNLRQYLEDHPETVAHCASLVKVMGVNKATLKLYDATSLEEFMGGLPAIFGETTYGVFQEELLSLVEGQTTFESEAINRTLTGENKHVLMRCTVVPGYEETLSKVLISIVDITAIKNTEKALRESEAKYRRLSENSPAVVYQFMMTPDGSFTYPYLNETVKDIFGVSPEEVMEDPSKLLAMIHPDDQKSFRQSVMRSAASVTKYHEIIRCLKKDSIVWIEAHSVPEQQPDGSIIWDGFFLDITSRKQAEEALHASEAEKQAILDNSPIAIWCFDGEKYSYLSKEWYRFTAQDKTLPLTVDRWIERVHPDDLEKSCEVWKKHWTSKTAHYNDFRLLEKDGEYRYIHCLAFPVFDDAGSFLHFQGFNIDVTDQKRAEDTLRESQEKFRSLVDQAAELLFLHDLKGNLVDVNRAAVDNTGYSKEELKKMTVFDIDPKARDRNDMQHYWEALKVEDPPATFEVTHKRKDGSTYPAEVVASKILLHNESYILGLARDITERKELEKRLRQAQKMESIGTLAGGIAHDFNNLLFPIIGMSELLLEDLPKGSLVRENTEQILKAGKRGSDLVKQILAFSRQSEQKMIPTRIQQILKEVVKLSRSTIPSNIEIHQDIQPDCGMVMADPTQIHQVAMNIVTNAYHAVEDTGGRISITLKESVLKPEKSNHMNLPPGHYAALSISDTGHGISSDVMDKIFEPYFTTKEQGKGTGLGLAVAYGIIREHKGTINVDSEIRKGTTFTVHLPLMEKSNSAKSIDTAQKWMSGDERILLVDDDESVVNLEKQMLERMGYQVTSRLHSIEALEAFKNSPYAFDLVLTDMSMPKMTGVQLTEALLSIRPDIPIIICTGFSEHLTKEKIASLGIKGFLMKPIVGQKMAQMVRDVLDQSKA